MALEGTIGILITLLFALVLMKYAGLLNKMQKPAAVIAAGTMFYFIDLAWNASTLITHIPINIATWVTFAWQLIAFVLIIVGALWGAIELVLRKR